MRRKSSVILYPSDETAAYRWLATGDAAFAAMVGAIRSAKRAVRLEMYIFEDCELGRTFRTALIEACRRGASVRVLVDDVGSMSLDDEFWAPLVAAGGEFRRFNRMRIGPIGFRDHRKILVCDEATAFVGGHNVAPRYQGDGVTRGWMDIGLQLTGPVARALAVAFDGMFSLAGDRILLFSWKRLAQIRRGYRVASADLLLSGPGRMQGSIKRAIRRDLAQAGSARIMSAYFLPTWSIRRELCRLARRGRVQLVLAGVSDVAVSQLASRRLYRSLMKAGVEIYEYQPQMLHAKLIILGSVAYVGSANLDVRSLRINYELLVRLSDPRLAAEAGEIFAQALSHSRRVDPASWDTSRSMWEKLKERLAYFILVRVDPYFSLRLLRKLQ